VVVIALMGASLASQLTAHGIDRVYYGTDTRAFELLAGVLLACCWPTIVKRRTVTAGASVIGVGMLVLTFVLWSTTSFGSSWLLHGGLAGVALVSVLVIAAAASGGPVRALGSWRPLVAVGLVSYGIYLIHWPVYLALDPPRTGMSGWSLFALRCLVTAVLATVSYFVVELPFRRGSLGRLRVAPLMWASGVAVVALAAPILIPLADTRFVVTNQTFERARRLVREQEATRSAISVPPGAAPPLKALVVGDSTGVIFAGGLASYGTRTGAVEVRSGAVVACPFGAVDEFKWINQFGLVTFPVSSDCAGAREQWRSLLRGWRPDVIIGVGGPTDATQLHPTGASDDQWSRPTDPAGQAIIANGITSASDLLDQLAPGVPQLWLESPYVFRSAYAEQGASLGAGPEDPAFIDVYNSVLERLAASRPSVAVVPWGDAFNREPISADASQRSDGVHPRPSLIDSLLDEWWPKLVAAREAVLARSDAR
jgi:hypothetical protein